MYSAATADMIAAFRTNPWRVLMDIVPVSGTALLVTEENLVSGSLTVDRYVSTGSVLPVGTATAGEVSFVLDNSEHDFDGVVFDGAEIYLRFVADDTEGNPQTLPVGYFTIDEAPRILDKISITALDRMVQFDFIPQVTFPCTVSQLYIALRTQAGITGGSLLENFPNYNYMINTAPDNIEELTARQLLQYCCQIMGANAQIGRSGSLLLYAYSSAAPSVSIDETLRYSSDIREPVSVTGVSVTTVDGDNAMTGVEGYVLEINDNPLIQHDPDSLDFSSLVGITFCPFNAQILPSPWLDCMDALSFVKDEQPYTVYITKMTQTVNAATAIEGTGESQTKKGYAAIDPLTVREQQILRNLRTRASERITQAEQNAIDFSKIIGNALGLYDTRVDADGATYYYFHNQETLEDSSIIYTFTAQGFGIATSWGGSHAETEWQWGVGVLEDSPAVSAIFTYLTAHQITADQIDVSTINTKMITLSEDGEFADGKTIGNMIDEQMAGTVASAEESANTLASYANQLFIGDLKDKMPGKYTKSTPGVAIGKASGSNFIPSAIFTENKLSFCDQSGNEVAWISQAQLHINDAEIMSTMKMGGYRWDIESDGSIILRWVGVNG